MNSSQLLRRGIAAALAIGFAGVASGQSFQVQCPQTTPSHPGTGGTSTDGSQIKCQQISGGDGFATMGDGTQTYLFAFGPLSGMADIAKGLPGTKARNVFMDDNTGRTDLLPGAPWPNYGFNGAVGVIPDYAANLDSAAPPGLVDSHGLDGHVDPRIIMDVGTLNGSAPAPMMAVDEDDEFFLTLTNVGQIMRPDLFEQHTVHWHGYPNASAFYDGVPDASVAINIGASFTYYYLAPEAGTYFWHCHITPPEHLQMGMEGQIYVRPRQNRVTGDLSDALGYYNTLPGNTTVMRNGSATAKRNEYERVRKRCSADDILCSNNSPAANTATNDGSTKYAYNDGDGSTQYDVEYPIQLMGFDPNFHFVGMTFNPESFTDMKDKYFLLNGRSYPDTVGGYTCKAPYSVAGIERWQGCTGATANTVVPGPMTTQGPDGVERTSQPQATVINIPAGGRALLRLSDLNITEMQTLATLGIPMTVVGWNAKLLRAQDGTNTAYQTNSITLGGGESADVILDATGYTAGQKFYLYTPNLDHLTNDAENFGGMMTEINICTSVDPTTKLCTVDTVSGSRVAANL